MLFPTSNIETQTLSDDLFNEKKVCLSVLRLDKLHPVISGNKLFKLHFFLQKALLDSSPGIVTFGGPYSNHLVATAYACKEAGLKSVGIVRGERPALLSHTLNACMEYGMRLTFLSRAGYDKKDLPGFLDSINKEHINYMVVPEGGYHPMGASGAAMIMDLINNDATHICCAAGTATTISGLLTRMKKGQQIIGIPVLKNMNDLPGRISLLTGGAYDAGQLKILNDYHFGGYAKKTTVLTGFMNSLYQQHHLPTDFIYTAKMMFGIIDCIKKNVFEQGSKITCIHTGGLQGNLSLLPGTLVF